jgi:hypothetical protein
MAGKNSMPFNFQQERFIAKSIEQVMFEEALRGAWGDPHFEIQNSKGEKVTVNHKGEDGHAYNILDTSKGDGLVIDARYAPYADTNNPQVMDKVRVQAGNETLNYDKDGNAVLNGQKLEKNKEYNLKDGSKLKILDNGNVDVISREKDATIHLTREKSDKMDDYYINIDPEGKLGNGNKEIGGILGIVKQKDGKITEEELKKEVEKQKLDVTDKRAIT